MGIKEKANKLARKHGTRNPEEIIKGMNVILISAPLCGIRGFYQYFQRNNIIYIDETLEEHERKFVIAHELGHMLLHKKSNRIFMDTRTCFNSNKFENEANLFAMELLVPENVLKEYSGCTTEKISHLLGYEKKLIELRLK